MENFPSMETYAKRMSLVTCILIIIITAGGVVFYQSADALIFALGAMVCASSNIVKIYWLKKSVEKATDMESAYAPNYVRGQGMLRMLFTLAVLVGAAFLSQLEVLGFAFLFGAVFGLLTMPVAAYSMALFTRKDFNEKGANHHV